MSASVQTQSTQPTISMQWVKHGEGNYAVELTLTGLVSEQHAEAAMAHLERVLCGSAIATN